MPDATCVPLASAAAPNLLQEELEELFGAIDRAKGQATGFIDKVRVGVGWGGVGGSSMGIRLHNWLVVEREVGW